MGVHGKISLDGCRRAEAQPIEINMLPEPPHMNTKQIIEEVISLPVEDRALIADSLLRSLNQPQSEIDNAWREEANRRLDELRSGRIKRRPGNEVFDKIWERLK